MAADGRAIASCARRSPPVGRPRGGSIDERSVQMVPVRACPLGSRARTPQPRPNAPSHARVAYTHRSQSTLSYPTLSPLAAPELSGRCIDGRLRGSNEPEARRLVRCAA